MRLNETDKAWVRQEIQAAQKLRGGLSGFIKEWSGTGAAVAILIFFLVQWNGYAEFRTLTGVRLNNIEKSLEKRSGTIATIQLSQIASNPTDSHNIQEAKRLVASARETNISLDQTVIETAGKKFIQAAQSNPDAWDTAMAFLNYRSFLNAQAVPSTQDLVAGNDADFVVEFNAKFGGPGSKFLTSHPKNSEMLPGSRSALFLQIGHEGRVVRAPKDLVFDATGTNIFLDGYHLRNVTVYGARITYNGGPLIMENVYFVNCTFDVKQIPRGQQFADATLSNVPVNFSASTHS